MGKLSTFDLIAIVLRHLSEITEAVPHIAKALEILRPLTDELSERGVTPQEAKEAVRRFSEGGQWRPFGDD